MYDFFIDKNNFGGFKIFLEIVIFIFIKFLLIEVDFLYISYKFIKVDIFMNI